MNLLLRFTGLIALIASVSGKVWAEKPINIAMTAAFVSEHGVDIYADISEYIAQKTKIETDFVTGLSYSAVNAMVEEGEAEIAFICGYPYISLHDDKEVSPVKLLVAPIMKSPLYEGKPKYYSYVITHKDSTARSFEDLRGKTWVYNDVTSNSGYNMPRAKLVDMGETDGFFGKILHSGAHEESIRMVAEGQAFASAVDSLVLDYARAEGEDFAYDVKIIERLGPAGAPPVVHSHALSSEKSAKIQKALVDMHNDPEGREILDRAYVDRFVIVDDSNYDDVRAMHRKAVEANFMTVK